MGVVLTIQLAIVMFVAGIYLDVTNSTPATGQPNLVVKKVIDKTEKIVITRLIYKK